MRRQGEDKVPTDTIVLTFDSPKPPTSIRAAYLTLSVRPYVPNPMRCFKCQRFGHGKDRCRRSAELCARCGKGGHAEHQCSAAPLCTNCHGEHSASSKECPKYLEELAILRYRAEHGGTFQEARRNVVVEKPREIAKRTYASAVRSGLVKKTAAPPKESGRISSVPTKGAKTQKDSPASTPRKAAESVPAKRGVKSPCKRQETPRADFNRFAPLLDMETDLIEPLSSIWGDSGPPTTSCSSQEEPPSPSPSQPDPQT